MSTLTTLNVRIGADISGFEQQMGKLQRSLSTVGNNLRSVGKSMSMALTVPIAGAGAAAIKAASDVEEMEAKFNTVFRNVGGRVTRELATFAKEVGRSRFELMGMSATLGDIFKPMGFTESAAADLSVQMTKLAVDLGSFNNMPMDEALQRLRGGLVGSHENLLTFGVRITEGVLKQELMRMGAEKLTGAQLEQAKVQARLNLIMAGTADAQGDAARTSDSFANQMQRLRNAAYDLGVQIGKILLPVATELVQKFQRAVDFVSNLSPEMQRMGVIIAGVAAAAGPLVFAFGGIASTLSAVARGLTLGLGLFNPWTAGIAAAAAIGVTIYKNWKDIPDVFKRFVDRINEDFGPALETMKENWGLAKDAVTDALSVLITWWSDNKDAILSKLGEVFTALSGAMGAALEALGMVLGAGLNLMIGFWSAHGTAILSTFDFTFRFLLTFLESFFTQMAGYIRAGMALAKGDFATAHEELRGVAQTSWSTIKTQFELGLDAARKAIDTSDDPLDNQLGSSALADAVTAAKGSIATAFDAIKSDTEKKLVTDNNSVSKSTGAAKGAVGDLEGAVLGLEKIDPSYSAIIAAIAGAPGESGGNSIKGVAEAAKESVDELFDSIPQTLEMPDWNIEPPEDVKTSALGWWNNFKRTLGDVKDNAFNINRYFYDINNALDVLYKGKTPEWMENLFTYANNTVTLLRGLEAITALLDLQTWKDFANNLWDMVSAIAEIVLGLGRWIAAQLGLNAAQSGSAIVNPNVAGGAAGAGTGGAGAAGGAGGALGGILGAVGVSAAWLSGLAYLGQFTGSTLAENGFDPTTYGGGNLAGLFQGDFGGITGLDFGSSWLTGGSGRMSQTINVVMDGQTIATATAPFMAGELEIRGTNF